MTAFLLGPLFFVIAISVIVVGVSLLAFLWRQGWVITGVGFLAMGLAVPGWLTVVGVFGFIGSIVTYRIWSTRKLGQSL